MKFFKPQIQLAREPILDAPDVFFLHIVTFCPQTCFRADGHLTDDSNLANGLYKVKIKLLEDTTLPDFDYITPVVHTLDLGAIDFPGGEGEIEVQVIGAVVENRQGRGSTDPLTTTTKTGGSGTVSTTSAEDKSRPITTDTL